MASCSVGSSASKASGDSKKQQSTGRIETTTASYTEVMAIA